MKCYKCIESAKTTLWLDDISIILESIKLTISFNILKITLYFLLITLTWLSEYLHINPHLWCPPSNNLFTMIQAIKSTIIKVQKDQIHIFYDPSTNFRLGKTWWYFLFYFYKSLVKKIYFGKRHYKNLL
jgi:hypothetical protein